MSDELHQLTAGSCSASGGLGDAEQVMKKMARTFSMVWTSKVLLAHPDNITLIQKALAERLELPDGFPPISDCLGIKFRGDKGLAREVPTGRILFPEHRFIEWEASDYEWALALGLAKREMAPVFYWLHEPAGPSFLEPRVLLSGCTF